MRACRRETAGSSSWTVLPAARPMVISPTTGSRVPSASTNSSMTLSSTGRTARLLEVFGQDRVRVEGGYEELELFEHIRAHGLLVVAQEDVCPSVDLLVEALGGLLVEDAITVGEAVRAAEQDQPVHLVGLLPVDRIDEARVAFEADVEAAVSWLGVSGLLDDPVLFLALHGNLIRGGNFFTTHPTPPRPLPQQRRALTGTERTITRHRSSLGLA